MIRCDDIRSPAFVRHCRLWETPPAPTAVNTMLTLAPDTPGTTPMAS